MNAVRCERKFFLSPGRAALDSGLGMHATYPSLRATRSNHVKIQHQERNIALSY